MASELEVVALSLLSRSSFEPQRSLGKLDELHELTKR